MRSLLDPTVAVPLAVILAMQSVLTMGSYALPVVIPVAAADIGVDPESVGFFVSGTYVGAMVAGLASGGLLAHLGPTRVFQILLVLVAAGAGALWLASPLAAVAGAILIGISAGPMNPAGSHVLSRVTPPASRAFVFSLKQCGTPAGGMLAGTVLPPLMLAYDWRVAMASIPAMALALVALAPFGSLGSRDREGPAERWRPARALGSVGEAMGDPTVRAVTVTGMCMAACQMSLGTYLVVYLWREAGYSPEQAGLVFATLHVSGIASRIVLGAIADRFVPARYILAMLGMGLSVALVLILNLTSAWPLTTVYAVMVLAGATGNGWVGLFFAELARLAPPTRVAEIAGGSQFVMYGGLVAGPVAFGALLKASGGFAAPFGLFAVLALGCGAYLALVRTHRP